MPVCKECGERFWKVDMRGEVCFDCADKAAKTAAAGDEVLAEQAALRADQVAAIPITTETASSFAISERLDVVSGVCVFGLNIVKDVLIGGRDLFGGRSETYQKSMQEARRQAVSDMRAEAYELAADAVVAVSITYQNINLTTGSMVAATATGTAVKLVK